jgi:hypothetical protein
MLMLEGRTVELPDDSAGLLVPEQILVSETNGGLSFFAQGQVILELDRAANIKLFELLLNIIGGN